MKQVLPFGFVDGSTLDPQQLNANMRQMEQDLRDVDRVAYHHWQTRIEWGAATEATAADDLRRLFRPPWDVEVTGLQLEVYGDAGKTFSVGMVGFAGEDGVDVEGLGSSDRALTARAASARCEADDDVEFVLSCDETTWSIAKASLIVSWRYRRPGSRRTLAQFSEGLELVIPSGPSAGNIVENEMDTYAQEAADLHVGASTYRPSITVVPGPLGASVGDYSPQVFPDMGRTLERVEVCANSPSGTVSVIVNSDSAPLGGTGVTPAGSLAVGRIDLDTAQSGDGAHLPAQDWSLDWLFSSGPVPTVCYAVLYWR